MSATIEEVSDHSDHEHGAHGHSHDEDPTSAAALDKIQSRAERKARKALLGLGLKKVPGITRVTLRRPKNVCFPLHCWTWSGEYRQEKASFRCPNRLFVFQILFVIASPDVYKSPNSDCYLVFGEAKIEDVNQQAQLSAAQQLAQSGGASLGGGAVPSLEKSGAGDDDDDDMPELEATEEDGPVDETGLDPKEIELVMAQVNCSRAKAVKVLKENGGDIINAIMAATD
ncbi:hypothetical protein DFH11DRAFT_1006701 [Phellopilus nigrolimitatus]|nr:hypothetical protein DFH11DRAFT_1006701 [Phellopilus nigrolimitatus]